MRRLLKVTLLMAVFLVALGAPALAQTDDYTPQVGGLVVTDPVEVGGIRVGRLPFTGSDNTPSLVLTGLGVIAAGGVIVIATRRRSEVLQRA